MFSEPISKPMVLGWRNPLANGRLTIRQDKTRQDKTRWVLVPRTKTKTHRTCLSVNLASKVPSLASSLCEQSETRKLATYRSCFQQVFNRVFNNFAKGGV